LEKIHKVDEVALAKAEKEQAQKKLKHFLIALGLN
jgi:hypothetical protein